MATLIHADIFFFVTTVAVILLTVLLVILFIYLFKIVGNVKRITDKARLEGDFFMNELHDMALRMKARRFGFRALFRFIRHLAGRYY